MTANVEESAQTRYGLNGLKVFDSRDLVARDATRHDVRIRRAPIEPNDVPGLRLEPGLEVATKKGSLVPSHMAVVENRPRALIDHASH
jgi:hypothetical protein